MLQQICTKTTSSYCLWSLAGVSYCLNTDIFIVVFILHDENQKKNTCIVINLTNKQKYNETIEVNHLAAWALHQGKN